MPGDGGADTNVNSGLDLTPALKRGVTTSTRESFLSRILKGVLGIGVLGAAAGGAAVAAHQGLSEEEQRGSDPNQGYAEPAPTTRPTTMPFTELKPTEAAPTPSQTITAPANPTVARPNTQLPTSK